MPSSAEVRDVSVDLVWYGVPVDQVERVGQIYQQERDVSGRAVLLD